MRFKNIAWSRLSAADWFGIAVFLLFIVAAVFAPLITPFDPTLIQARSLQPPDGVHWFGTDDVGRDIFSYVVYGSRVALQLGVTVALMTFVIGTVLGAIAGYVGGRVDTIITRIAEFFQVIPGFVLALVIVAILGQDLWLTSFALGITLWPIMARLVRAQVLSLKNREYVDAARTQGYGHITIVVREILPNVMPAALVQMTLDVGSAVLMEAGMSYLGLGDPNRPSWGMMLNRSQQYLEIAPWISIAPGVAVFLFVLSANLVGDTLNDYIHGRLRKE